MDRVCEGARSASMTRDGYRDADRSWTRDQRITNGSLLEAEHGRAILLDAVTPAPVLRVGVAYRLDPTGSASAQGERDADHCHDHDSDGVRPFALISHWPSPSNPGIHTRDGES